MYSVYLQKNGANNKIEKELTRQLGKIWKSIKEGKAMFVHSQTIRLFNAICHTSLLVPNSVEDDVQHLMPKSKIVEEENHLSLFTLDKE